MVEVRKTARTTLDSAFVACIDGGARIAERLVRPVAAAAAGGGRTVPSRRRRAAAFVLQRLLGALSSVTPVVAIDRNGSRVFVSTRDQSDITRGVLESGRYESDLIQTAVKAMAEHASGRPGLADGWFVDVGANIGITTLEVFAQHGAARSLAFEPHPDLFSILRLNLFEAGIADRVRVHRLAVSDVDGVSGLAIASDNQGDHRLVVATGRAVPGSRASSRAITDVETRTLDSALAADDIAPAECALVWVDTQGHEANVLAGASALIAAGVPFVCEYWPDGLRQAGALDRFYTIVESEFERVIDLSDPGRVLTTGELRRASWRLGCSRPYTNLMLLRA